MSDSSGKEFSFEFTISEADYKKFYGLRLRKMRWVFLILIPIYLFLATMFFAYPKEHTSFSSNAYLLIIPALLLILFILINWVPVRTYRADPFIKKPRTIHFSEKGIQCTSPNNNLFVEWKDVSLYIERKKNFYFMLGYAQGIIIPDHVFSSDPQANIFRNFVHSAIGPKKRNGISLIPGKLRWILYGIILLIFGTSVCLELFSVNYQSKALKEYDKKNYEKAIEYFNKELQEHPDNPAAFKWRGYSYYSLKKDELAKKDLLSYISINKKDGEAYFFLGLSCFNLNDSSSCFYMRKSDSLKYDPAKKYVEDNCAQ